jgi:NAD(P)-dependent dehydrogenase (short-subunit alcohol dehydrogenase family)
MQLSRDSVAVITGAASGIGRATAGALARKGVSIVVADVNRERMPETVEELRGLGVRAEDIVCDVSRDADVEALARESIARMGRVDLLYSNAGVIVAGPPEEVPMTDWEWIMQINLLGPVRCARAFLPHMIERGSGHIVSTASFAGLVAHNPLTIPYDTSKHGVVGFSAGLALYARPKGIGVSVVCPGYIPTNLMENSRIAGPEASEQRMPDRVTQADDLAARIVAAVEQDRFLVLSQDEHLAIIQKRWQDIDRHIARQIEVLSKQTSQ